MSRTSSPYWCDHVNTSTNSVEIFDVLADLWPKDEFASFYYIPIKSLCDNASPRNMNNSHISRTTARSSHAKPAWPICSLCWCGHVICFVLWISVCSWYYCPKVECYAFIWNQLVFPSRAGLLTGHRRYEYAPKACCAPCRGPRRHPRGPPDSAPGAGAAGGQNLRYA